jgi:hypothetical protein
MFFVIKKAFNSFVELRPWVGLNIGLSDRTSCGLIHGIKSGVKRWL